jgi:hypothetical protein
LKEGDAMSQLFFNFALEYAIRKVQVKQLLVYADDNIFGGSIHTVNKNT